MNFIPVSKSVLVEVDVDVEVAEVIGRIDDHKLIEELEERGYQIVGSGSEADALRERLVEAAYLAAREAPSLPPAIRDLLWHVHGRAIA